MSKSSIPGNSWASSLMMTPKLLRSLVLSPKLSRRDLSRGYENPFPRTQAIGTMVAASMGAVSALSVISERTHEFGIRLALGAERRNILQMVLRQGLRLAIAGAAVGLVGALLVSRFLATLLY